ARADMAAAVADYRRQRELTGKGAATQRDLENAQDTYERAKAELQRAAEKFALLSRRPGKEAVNQTYTLRAPMEGEVTARLVGPGMEIVGQYGGGIANELFVVADLRNVWVLADIYEVDLTKVHRAQSVSVRVDALPGQVFVGRVEWVSNVLDPMLHTAKMRCTVPNPKGLLKPDMYATLSTTSAGKPTLAVPRTAVVKVGDTPMVFVETQGDAPDHVVMTRRPVSVDDDDDEANPLLAVLHGLSAGEHVVVEGAAHLAERL
ncbi:MAG: efflux RND transporter periplasmic adaptor subunit, partial [Deltaproteobacteria bacterium]